MKRIPLSRLLCLNARFASSSFRYVESPPPIPVKKRFRNKALPNSPTVNITIEHSKEKVVKANNISLEQGDCFSVSSKEGAVKLIGDQSDFFKLMVDPVADQTYFKMFTVTNTGFLQFREHLREVLKKMQDENRFVLTGNRQCGKTLTCYALLRDAFTSQFGGLIIPAIHLSKWFQDTDVTNFLHVGNEMLDFPDFNVEFLRYLMLCNTLPGNPDSGLLANTTLLEDERWTSQLYSFKGDSLLNVVKTGMTNPPIACHVIRVLFANILHQQIPTRIIVDNANLLSEIHSSKFEGLRQNKGVDEEWWNQPKLLPDKILLLRSLKELLRKQENGHVFLTTDPVRDIRDEVIADTGGYNHHHIVIPNTPNETEYLQFLNLMRHFGFISRNLDSLEVMELTHLVGRSYPDTFKYVHFF